MYLAVDAGGTKTDFLLADDTRELARVRGGCIKRMRVDAATAAENLHAALAQLSELSGQSLAGVQRTCVGTAGETVALVTDWLRAELPRRVAGELLIVGDVEIALDAAFQGGPGALVLAGTGSNVAGRRQDGLVVRAGGWGPALADQGSAYRIGLSGLRAAFLARDEGRSTVLLEEAVSLWGLGSEQELIGFANQVPSPDFSRFSEKVHWAATVGDTVAGEVVRQQGQELGYLVRIVLRQVVNRMPEEGSTPGLAFAGSVMEKAHLVRSSLLDEVRSEFGTVRALDGVIDPLQGALWRARTQSTPATVAS